MAKPPDQRDARRDRAGLRVLGQQLSTGQLVVLAFGLVTLGVLIVFWAIAPNFSSGDGPIATTRTGILVVGAATIAATGALLNLIETQRANREADQRERYSMAIDQLGHHSVDVRLGGIYALQRVAEDSPRDLPTVVEVLCAFVREHGQAPKDSSDEGLKKYRPATDVQAALNVITRVHNPDLNYDLDLVGAHIELAELYGANLVGANLGNASAHRANLTHADLTLANLYGVDLTRAHLDGANRTEAAAYAHQHGLAER